MQVSKFLDSNTKFSFKNHRATEKFGEDTFAKWSNTNFYRTSYGDMDTKRSPPGRRAAVIPGFAGYVPRVKVNN